MIWLELGGWMMCAIGQEVTAPVILGCRSKVAWTGLKKAYFEVQLMGLFKECGGLLKQEKGGSDQK